MTVQEMIESVYEELGEPADLEPYDSTGTFDITTEGATKILRWLNRAYIRIVMWRSNNGYVLKFKDFEGRAYFRNPVITGTITSGSGRSILTDLTETDVDHYNSWSIEITSGENSGQRALVIDYDGAGTLAVHDVFNNAFASGDTFSLTKNFFRIVDSSDSHADEEIALADFDRFTTMLDIYDEKRHTRILPTTGSATFHDAWHRVGDPGSYIKKSGFVEFDSVMTEERTFRIDYLMLPELLETATQVPVIPNQFHEAITLFASWIGLRRNQEWSGAYSTKMDIRDIMERIQREQERWLETNELRLVPTY